DELLPECARHVLADNTRTNVGGPAGSERNDNRNGPRWIGLRACHARDGRQRGSACSQIQNSAAGKVPFEPPPPLPTLDPPARGRGEGGREFERERFGGFEFNDKREFSR